jgi:hypothetical protein
MTILKIHSKNPYASRAGEFYRRQRDDGVFAYPCPHQECDAKFYIKSQLSTHLLNHSGETPFVCNLCNYTSKQKILLDKHRQREHDIPLPSTRISRYRTRTSLPAICECKRDTYYTGKKPNNNYKGVVARLEHYERENNIINLLETNKVTKRDFYADKAKGYIIDHWVIYTKARPLRLFSIGNSQRKAEKITAFINQIHNITQLYKDPQQYNQEISYLQKDNKKKIELINTALQLYPSIATLNL